VKNVQIKQDGKQTTVIQSNTTQFYFNFYPYMHATFFDGLLTVHFSIIFEIKFMHATCFGLYLGHPQSFQHKNHTEEDKMTCVV